MSEAYWEVAHPATGNLLADFDTEEEAIAYIEQMNDPALSVRFVIRDDVLYDYMTGAA